MKNLFALITGRRSTEQQMFSYPKAAPYSRYGNRPHVLVSYQCHRSLLHDLRRLVSLHRLREQMNPSLFTPREYTVESLQLIESLIPIEPRSVIMDRGHQQLLARFIRAELTQLMNDKVSPFWDRPKSFVYDDLTRALEIIESAILITPCHSTPTN